MASPGSPGGAIPEHYHNCEEDLFDSLRPSDRGAGRYPHPMKTCDASWVPAGVPHFFKNASPTKKLRIFWTYASIDATRTMVSTGETRPIAAEHLKLV